MDINNVTIDEIMSNDCSLQQYIELNNLWNIWVHKDNGGLQCSLPDGLKILHDLAYRDGSLGWLVTLVSGANYFLGFLDNRMVNEITGVKNYCLGGSGKIADKAIKTNNGYIISGEWQYATGAPFLSHFTLNAKVFDGNNIPLLHSDGSPVYKSFVVSKDLVEIIDSWNAFGMEKTYTKNYRLSNGFVPDYAAFEISDKFNETAYLIHQFSFNSFAAFTLTVNYIGMYRHFLDEIAIIVSGKMHNSIWNEKYGEAFKKLYAENCRQFYHLTGLFDEITMEFWLSLVGSKELKIIEKEVFNLSKILSNFISNNLNELYRYGGLSSAQKHTTISVVYRDLITALQHSFFL